MKQVMFIEQWWKITGVTTGATILCIKFYAVKSDACRVAPLCSLTGFAVVSAVTSGSTVTLIAATSISTGAAMLTDSGTLKALVYVWMLNSFLWLKILSPDSWAKLDCGNTKAQSTFTHSRTCLTVCSGVTSGAAITLIRAIGILTASAMLTNTGRYQAFVYVWIWRHALHVDL